MTGWGEVLRDKCHALVLSLTTPVSLCSPFWGPTPLEGCGRTLETGLPGSVGTWDKGTSTGGRPVSSGRVHL